MRREVDEGKIYVEFFSAAALRSSVFILRGRGVDNTKPKKIKFKFEKNPALRRENPFQFQLPLNSSSSDLQYVHT